MTRVVVDASVALKWFVPEVLADKAAILLDGSYELAAPDLLIAEIGNALWKKVGRNELTVDEGLEILAAFESVPIEIVPSDRLVKAAFEIAAAHGRTVYDGLYVALAVAHDGVAVTGDDRLVRCFQGRALGPHIRSLAQFS